MRCHIQIDYVDDEEEEEELGLSLGLCIPQDRLEDIDFSAYLNDDLIILVDQYSPTLESADGNDVVEVSSESEPISGDLSCCSSGEQQRSSDDDDGAKKSKSRKRGRGRRRRIKQRRCSHCQTEETPLWRMGPLGRNTLCNACGLRHKMGLLLSNYRPAASPNFDTAKHSNFHKRLVRNNNALSHHHTS